MKARTYVRVSEASMYFFSFFFFFAFQMNATTGEIESAQAEGKSSSEATRRIVSERDILVKTAAAF